MADSPHPRPSLAPLVVAALFAVGLAALWQAGSVTALGAFAIALAGAAATAALYLRGASGRAELTRRLATLERQRSVRDDDLAADAADAAAALEALPDPIVQLDAGRVVVGANAAARALLGDAVGRDLIATLRHPGVLAAVDDALAGGAPEPVALAWPGPVELHFEARVVRAGAEP